MPISIKNTALTLVLIAVTAMAIGVLRLNNPVYPVVFNVVDTPQLGLPFIARHLGLFDKEGLDVSFRHFASGRNALDALLQGSGDVVTALETPIVIQACAGKDMVILASLHRSEEATALVARKDRDIRSFADIRNKTIGVPFNTNAHFFLNIALNEYGIPAEKTKIIDIPITGLPSALNNGEADAVATWNITEAMSAAGTGNSVTLFSETYIEMSGLVASPRFVSANPDATVKLIRALHRAAEWAQANPEEAIEIMSASLEGRKTTEDIVYVLKRISFAVMADNVFMFTLQSEAEWFADTGQCLPFVDFRKLLQTDHLKSVNRDAVTLFEYQDEI